MRSARELFELAISKDDNRIQLCYCNYEHCGVSTYIERKLDILYDLIQAGLVEKVRYE